MVTNGTALTIRLTDRWGIDEFTNVLQESGYDVLLASHDAQWHLKGRDMLVVAEAP